MLSSWSLKAKTIVAFAGISLSLLAVGGANFVSQQKVKQTYEKIPQVTMQGMIHVSRMRAEAFNIRVQINRVNLALKETPPNLKDAAKFAEDVTKDMGDYAEAESAFKLVSTSAQEKKVFEEVATEWATCKKALELLVMMGKSAAADPDMFSGLMSVQYRAAADKHLGLLESLNNIFVEDAKVTTLEANETARIGNVVTLGVIAFGFLSALAMGFFFSRAITTTLIGLNARLKTGAEAVASASQKIATSGSELSASATQQAAALQQTVASVDEVSAMINKNADNAKQSQSVATDSKNSASKGREAVTGLIQSIDEISRSNAEIMGQIEESNRQMSEIVKVISEIGNKTKVINDIVFQTKLLSFNASVEAARAGEHGKGFAVVAEEVGNLAQMSGNAAKEISEMLDASSHRVEGIVAETKTKIERLIVVGRDKVQDGTTRARDCGTILEEIVQNVSQVDQLMGEIATASHEQSQGVQEITRAMAQLDQVTQQNAMASQSSADASESLSLEAQELRNIVVELTATLDGKDENASEDSTRSHESPKSSSKTLPFKKKQSPANHSKSHVSKKAAGSSDFPSDNDPRFEDA